MIFFYFTILQRLEASYMLVLIKMTITVFRTNRHINSTLSDNILVKLFHLRLTIHYLFSLLFRRLYTHTHTYSVILLFFFIAEKGWLIRWKQVKPICLNDWSKRCSLSGLSNFYSTHSDLLPIQESLILCYITLICSFGHARDIMADLLDCALPSAASLQSLSLLTATCTVHWALWHIGPTDSLPVSWC